MHFNFTAAAERALAHGAEWSFGIDRDELEAEALLLGLLFEPECRAAVMLARVAVDTPAVLQRWPSLKRRIPSQQAAWQSRGLSHDVELSLRLALDRLAAFPRPVELATEHILLGLAAADHDVAVWLRQQGVNPDLLAAEIAGLYGNGGNGDQVCPLDEAAASNEETKDQSTASASPEMVPEVRSNVAVFRTLDASANRAREAIRVIEDYARFVLDDRLLTEMCKELRHDLAAAVLPISSGCRLVARDTEADVGTDLATATERSRSCPDDVLAANFARLQESLRSLEEFAKLLDPNLGDRFKQLRYRVYTLERAVELTRNSLERLAAAKLCVLLDGRESFDEFERLARALVASGVPMIQFREKQLSDRELIARARLLRAVIDESASKPLLVINDRPDVAVLARADGVHIGQDDASVKDSREIVGQDALVGVSTHSIEQARQAVLDGANYLGVGPTFPSGTKRFSVFPGIELLRAVAVEIRLPAFAIGGVSRANLADVLAAGFNRVAVSGAILSADDPAQAVKELLAGLPKGEQ